MRNQSRIPDWCAMMPTERTSNRRMQKTNNSLHKIRLQLTPVLPTMTIDL